MQPKGEPILDIKEEDVFSGTDKVEYIGLKTDLDLKQRKWFNEDMKLAGYGGFNKLECTDRELGFHNEQAELCPVYFHTIRFTVNGERGKKVHFFTATVLDKNSTLKL